MPNPQKARPRAAFLSALTTVFLGAACAAPNGGPGAQHASREGNEDKERERASELEEARMDLELALLSAEEDQRQARFEVEQKAHALEQARVELASFREFARQHELDDEQLDVDRDAASLRASQQELEQMEQLYEAEPPTDPTGESTRDIVLERHRRDVEFAQRSLDLSRSKLAELQARQLPAKERELSRKVAECESEQVGAQAALRKAELEARQAVAKARAKLEKLERKGDAKTDESEGEHP